jgi:putative component of toxin-antitoxin plasmid stabilization module
VQCDALCRGSIRGRLASVALVDIGKPNAVAGGILDVRDKPGHGLSIADIGWRYV